MKCPHCGADWVLYSANTKCCGFHIMTGELSSNLRNSEWYYRGLLVTVLERDREHTAARQLRTEAVSSCTYIQFLVYRTAIFELNQYPRSGS